MIIRIDKTSSEPLYLQIRANVISGIARGELEPGFSLPSVRVLANDLGVNFHTVNKAYAVLRDEGYVLLHGRRGAVVADPHIDGETPMSLHEGQKMEEELYALALAFRARGGKQEDFVSAASSQSKKAYREDTDR